MPCGGLKNQNNTLIYIQRHSVPAKMNVKGTESSILYYNKKTESDDEGRRQDWKDQISVDVKALMYEINAYCTNSDSKTHRAIQFQVGDNTSA